MDFLLRVTINPLEWHSLTFAGLILLAILLQIALPWSPSRRARVLREVLIILPAVLLYFLVRGLVDSDAGTAFENAQRVIDLEQQLGIWIEEDVQDIILGSGWRTSLVNWVYIWGHWPVIALVVFWLVLRHYDVYPKYRNAMLISGVIGMIIFATFPVAPPRLMPEYGFTDTVTEQSNSYRVLQPPALANPYAAMPSLHFGWNLLMGIAVVRHTSSRVARFLGYMSPIAMFLAIVLSANHYILDGIVGGTIVLVSLAAANWLADAQASGGPLRRRIWPRAGRARPARQLRLIDSRELAPEPDGAGRRTAPEVIIPRPFVVAHRFGNSIAALRRAEQAGADVIEADIWPHRGRLEVRHTKTLGPVPVLWDRWSLERGWRPRLELREILAELDPETTLMLDVKGRDPDAPARIIETVRAQRPDQPVIVCSQNWRQIERFRPFPEAALVYSIGNRFQLSHALKRLPDEPWDAISVQAALLNRQVVQALKDYVEVVMTWPVNTIERYEAVTAWGVDGVTSDSLDVIAAITARRQTATVFETGLVGIEATNDA